MSFFPTLRKSRKSKEKDKEKSKDKDKEKQENKKRRALHVAKKIEHCFLNCTSVEGPGLFAISYPRMEIVLNSK